MEQATEQVSSIHAALVILADVRRSGGWVRRLELQPPVCPVPVVVLDVDPEDLLQGASPTISSQSRHSVTSTLTPSDPNGSSNPRQNVARQYLGSVGKVDNGIVAVTSLWADERVYWPVHAVPYTPASRLPGGDRDPGFRTKPQLAVELVQAAREAGIGFRAVVADCFYGDNPGFTDALGPPRCRSCWP